MPRTFRNTILSASAALLLAGVAGVVASGGVASAEVNPSARAAALVAAPVGTWTGTVQHGTTTGALTITLRDGGLVCLSSSDGSGDGGEGLGYWQSTSASQFNYRVLERLHNAAGATTGYVDVNQKATISGDAFTSSGTSRVYDQNGMFIATATATVNVSRTTTTPPVC